jgi:hypothetical protein
LLKTNFIFNNKLLPRVITDKGGSRNVTSGF